MRIGMGYQYHDRNIKMINNTRDENKAQKEKQKKKNFKSKFLCYVKE